MTKNDRFFFSLRCWMHESHSQWVLTVPVFASILTSLLFLMNVMRVLLTKLHRNSTNPAPIGVRKAVRAALILVPLFGIHYILIPYRPKHKTAGEIAYQIFSVILVSTQVRLYANPNREISRMVLHNNPVKITRISS